MTAGPDPFAYCETCGCAGSDHEAHVGDHGTYFPCGICGPDVCSDFDGEVEDE